MTPLTPLLGDYLSNLAAELSAHVLAAIPAWLQTAWRGDETDTAVRRCLDAGIAAFIRRAKADAPTYAELWARHGLGPLSQERAPRLDAR